MSGSEKRMKEMVIRPGVVGQGVVTTRKVLVCERCGTRWHRDLTAARAHLLNFFSELEHGERLPGYRRQARNASGGG